MLKARSFAIGQLRNPIQRFFPYERISIPPKMSRLTASFGHTELSCGSGENPTESSRDRPHVVEWSRFQRERYTAPFKITFAFVATHNHFVLDRGGKVFKQSAPIIQLPETATEDDHYALLAYLNSSTACFWMKQVCHNKTNASQKHSTDPARAAYEFAGTALEKLPWYGASLKLLDQPRAYRP